MAPVTTPTSTFNENPTRITSHPPTDAPSISNGRILSSLQMMKRCHKKPKPMILLPLKKMIQKILRQNANIATKCMHVVAKKNGTSNLLSHLANQCKEYLGRDIKKPKTLSFQPKKSEEEGKLIATSYSPKKCREAIVRYIILDEQPFRVVVGEGFRDMLRVFEPRLQVPYRITIERDFLKLYKKEKIKLKDYLVANRQRVSLTTDTWSSHQNLNYMCLTAHYIDDQWRLHKKILNFCTIVNHKGDTIGRAIATCLLEWGIDKVLTVTVDNATSNDHADKTSKMTSKVRNKLNELYDQYKLLYHENVAHKDETHNPSEMEIDSNEVDFATAFTTGFMKLVEKTDGEEFKTEVDRI
ncbi:BED zinc finger [Prunus dulcis]|uniref:BED zinc finger n=1 Tax=Prunus dulcis TaxID=3755 RepID=A0A4Y1RCW4_PRUDU|nr:BED zinc finger [Prunus dulcis]